MVCSAMLQGLPALGAALTAGLAPASDFCLVLAADIREAKALRPLGDTACATASNIMPPRLLVLSVPVAQHYVRQVMTACCRHIGPRPLGLRSKGGPYLRSVSVLQSHCQVPGDMRCSASSITHVTPPRPGNHIRAP